jgi:hypothetical protein
VMELHKNIFVLVLRISSIVIFSSGFMTSRVTLPHTSDCGSPAEASVNGASKPFDKLALMVIDGLRADFAIEMGNDNISLSETLLLPSLQAAAGALVCVVHGFANCLSLQIVFDLFSNDSTKSLAWQ